MSSVKRILTAAGGVIVAKLAKIKSRTSAKEVISTSEWRIILIVRPNDREIDDDKDTPIDLEILSVCTLSPQKSETIARKIGKQCTSYLRSRITRLFRQGRLIRSCKGHYCLPAPAEAQQLLDTSKNEQPIELGAEDPNPGRHC